MSIRRVLAPVDAAETPEVIGTAADLSSFSGLDMASSTVAASGEDWRGCPGGVSVGAETVPTREGAGRAEEVS